MRFTTLLRCFDMADLGQIGVLIDVICDAQYPYMISGNVTNSSGAPMQTYVVFINPGDGATTPPSIEKFRWSDLTGAFAAPFSTTTPRTVLCVDISDPHSNDIVFGKVVPK